MSEYYTASGSPSTGAAGSSSTMRAEFALIAAGFALLPTLAANGSLPVFVNSGATALEATSAATARTRLGVDIGTNVQAWDADLDALAALGSTGIAARTAANTWAQRTITGTAAEITLTNGNGVSGNPTISLPAALTFTGKTITGGTYASPTLTTPSLGAATATSINNLTITSSTGTLTIAALKTLTASNTLTLAGNDGSTLNVGAGGTLATSATTDTTNATNINAGTLGAGRMPLGITATPSAGQILVGNAGGTAYAAVALSSDATLASTGAVTLANSAGTRTNLGLGSMATQAASAVAITGGTMSGVPISQLSKSAAYTTVLADAGQHILHPAADNNARTFTIDSNANVAYATGTVLTFVNEINTVTIAITSDTMTLMGAGSTGSRTLAANGIATALKISATKWVISGTNLT